MFGSILSCKRKGDIRAQVRSSPVTRGTSYMWLPHTLGGTLQATYGTHSPLPKGTRKVLPQP